MARPKLRVSSDEQNQTQAVSEFLELHGRHVIGSAPNINPADLDALKDVNDRIRPNFEQMSTLLRLTMNDKAANLAHDLLSKLMLASWMTGVSAALSPEAKKWYDTVKGRAASEGKKKKASPKKTAMQDAIVREAKEMGLKLVASEQCARQIEPGVRQRCGVDEKADGFSWSTIKRETAKILKPSEK